jgi:RNA polymerase sigma-70 factor (ECF subfamily)
VFDDSILQSIAERHDAVLPQAESRHRALGDCIQELTTNSRELLSKCYAPGAKVKEVAQNSGRTGQAVYKALQRIRASLRTCVERRLSMENVK